MAAKSGLVDIAFLVDAYCGPVDIQKCQAYTRSMGNVATKGAPRSANPGPNIARNASSIQQRVSRQFGGVQAGGILMLIRPALQPRVIHTTHRCSDRLFLVHEVDRYEQSWLSRY